MSTLSVTKYGFACRLLAAGFALVLLGCDLSGSSPEVRPLDSSPWPQKVMATTDQENQCNKLYLKNKQGLRLSWKGAVPIELNFDPRFPKEFIPGIEAAVKSWNQVAGRDLFVLKGFNLKNSLPGDDGRNTIYFVRSEFGELVEATRPLFVEDGHVAVTRTLFSQNKIAEADVIFNGSEFSFSTSKVHLTTFDVETTALHELGHVLGLDHNDEDIWSTMYFGELSFGYSFREIDGTSRDLLQCEYL